MRKPGWKLRAMTMGALAFKTVLPARPPLTALKTTSGSSPARVASTSASPIAAMLQATMIWLASLVTLPAPTGPVSVTLDPMLFSTGAIFSNNAASPPTMMASVPSTALGSPPLTGASRKPTPFAAQAAPTFWETIGLMELMSTTTVPRRAPSRTPPAPSMACFTSGPSGSIVITISDRDATSRHDSPRAAPAVTAASTRAGTTSYTARVCPAFIRLMDIGRPMMPNTIKPIFAIYVLLCLPGPVVRAVLSRSSQKSLGPHLLQPQELYHPNTWPATVYIALLTNKAHSC